MRRQHFVVCVEVFDDQEWHEREVWRCLSEYDPRANWVTVARADTEVSVASAQRAIRTSTAVARGDA